MGVCGPTYDTRSWTFDLDPGGRDPVLGIERLQRAYFARLPGCDRGITVPAIVDVPTGQVVPNDYLEITLDLSTEWTDYHCAGAPDLYPEGLRAEIDEVMQTVFRDVNNGVYRCGFAGTQEAYATAYHRLFERLDWLSERLSERRYLMGDTITEADPPVHHAGALRRRLPRPLQVQPEQADRDAGAVWLRPGPVPDARIRRHHRLRPHQAALLPGAPGHQPDRHRAGRSQTCRDGPARTTANSSAGDHSAKAPYPLRPVTTRRCPLDTYRWPPKRLAPARPPASRRRMHRSSHNSALSGRRSSRAVARAAGPRRAESALIAARTSGSTALITNSAVTPTTEMRAPPSVAPRGRRHHTVELAIGESGGVHTRFADIRCLEFRSSSSSGQVLKLRHWDARVTWAWLVASLSNRCWTA